jgi:hypothetical protein
LRAGGVLLSQAPPKPRIVIRINNRPAEPSSEPSISLTTPAEREAEDEELDNEFADLEEESARFFANADTIEQEDVPDYMVEVGEKTSKDPDYQFCPAAHRKPLLHLFTKHYCQSELFPERLETEWTAESIRRNAVIEMYRFCYQRGLREVWGYMWACWYSPKMSRGNIQYTQKGRRPWTDVDSNCDHHEHVQPLSSPFLFALTLTFAYARAPAGPGVQNAKEARAS